MSAQFSKQSSVSEAVTQFLRERIAARTSTPLEEIHTSSVLADLALQSIDAVLICGEVEDKFGIELDPTAIFQHKTIGGFAAEVMAAVVESQ